MNILEHQARSFLWQCRSRLRQSSRIGVDNSCIQRPRRRYATPTQPGTAPAATEKPYYVTTPIYYVNAEPHVGHLYSLVLADVLKRWNDLKYRGATLLTGTDEHGMKVQKAAENADTPPGIFCSANAQKFKNLANKANISYDRFIRTTDEDHMLAVEAFWLQLQNRGYIYQSKHEGWYCVSDETFYPESQVHLIIEPQTGRKIYASKETGKEVTWTSEDNYHFRLAAFRERLLKHYEDNPNFVVPKQRMNFIVSEVTSGLSDLSISRPSSRLQWGIRVPNDDSQTIYVWLDALINYITMAGYPSLPNDPKQCLWPPNCQVIGKDIIRFHCIYWPAFLMALDLPITKQFLSHAHWTMNQEKMSKSLGNVVNPFHAMDRFGVDSIRYYLVRDGGYADDSAYENSYIIERYKAELQGGLGNMMARILRGKDWSLEECVASQRPSLESKLPEDIPLVFKDHADRIRICVADANKAMFYSNPRRALNSIMTLVKDVNKFFQEAEAWQHAKKSDAESQETAKRIVYISAEYLRIVCILLQPFMPERMKLALDMLGVRESARHWSRRAFGTDFKYGSPLSNVGSNGKVEESLFPALSSAY